MHTYVCASCARWFAQVGTQIRQQNNKNERRYGLDVARILVSMEKG